MAGTFETTSPGNRDDAKVTFQTPSPPPPPPLSPPPQQAHEDVASSGPAPTSPPAAEGARGATDGVSVSVLLREHVARGYITCDADAAWRGLVREALRAGEVLASTASAPRRFSGLHAQLVEVGEGMGEADGVYCGGGATACVGCLAKAEAAAREALSKDETAARKKVARLMTSGSRNVKRIAAARAVVRFFHRCVYLKKVRLIRAETLLKKRAAAALLIQRVYRGARSRDAHSKKTGKNYHMRNNRMRIYTQEATQRKKVTVDEDNERQARYFMHAPRQHPHDYISPRGALAAKCVGPDDRIAAQQAFYARFSQTGTLFMLPSQLLVGDETQGRADVHTSWIDDTEQFVRQVSECNHLSDLLNLYETRDRDAVQITQHAEAEKGAEQIVASERKVKVNKMKEERRVLSATTEPNKRRRIERDEAEAFGLISKHHATVFIAVIREAFGKERMDAARYRFERGGGGVSRQPLLCEGGSPGEAAAGVLDASGAAGSPSSAGKNNSNGNGAPSPSLLDSIRVDKSRRTVKPVHDRDRDSLSTGSLSDAASTPPATTARDDLSLGAPSRGGGGARAGSNSTGDAATKYSSTARNGSGPTLALGSTVGGAGKRGGAGSNTSMAAAGDGALQGLINITGTPAGGAGAVGAAGCAPNRRGGGGGDTGASHLPTPPPPLADRGGQRPASPDIALAGTRVSPRAEDVSPLGGTGAPAGAKATKAQGGRRHRGSTARGEKAAAAAAAATSAVPDATTTGTGLLPLLASPRGVRAGSPQAAAAVQKPPTPCAHPSCKRLKNDDRVLLHQARERQEQLLQGARRERERERDKEKDSNPLPRVFRSARAIGGAAGARGLEWGAARQHARRVSGEHGPEHLPVLAPGCKFLPPCGEDGATLLAPALRTHSGVTPVPTAAEAPAAAAPPVPRDNHSPRDTAVRLPTSLRPMASYPVARAAQWDELAAPAVDLAVLRHAPQPNSLNDAALVLVHDELDKRVTIYERETKLRKRLGMERAVTLTKLQSRSFKVVSATTPCLPTLRLGCIANQA